MNNVSKKSINFNQFGLIVLAIIVLSSLTFSCRSNNGGDQHKKMTSDDYINLSLKYYNNNDYLGCIIAAQKANKISPSSIAFSNICAAYNALKEYDKAIIACNNAIKLDPNNNLAKGNLAHSLKNKQ